jgi:hypothetical protein
MPGTFQEQLDPHLDSNMEPVCLWFFMRVREGPKLRAVHTLEFSLSVRQWAHTAGFPLVIRILPQLSGHKMSYYLS